MSDGKTLIDRDTFLESCRTTGTCEPYFNYQFDPIPDHSCIGFTCGGWREAMQFFVELASRDATLATNMADVIRQDTMAHDMVFFFPGFDLEDEDLEDEDTYGEDPLGGSIAD